MKVRCVACQTAFQLETDQVNITGSMVRCLKCSYIFMVYPPDYCGSPVTQDTNIDQSILDDLLEMQDDPRAQVFINEISEEGGNAMVDNKRAMGDFGEEDSESDTNDTEYADLPDLSELEKMIDWGDIKDLDDPPAKSNQNYDDTRDLDINNA